MLRRISKNKRGSVTIFVILIFISLLTLVFALISNAKSLAIKGCAQQLNRVWGNSVLGEYDRNLFKDYGIMAFYGYESTVNKTIEAYARETTNDKRYVSIDNVSSSLGEYSLLDKSNFKNQVLEAAKISVTDIGELIKNKEPNKDRTTGREIRNQKILQSLPSQGIVSSNPITHLVDALKNLKGNGELDESAGDKFFIQKYINYYFDDNLSKQSKIEPFFRNEKEYLLCGKTSDDKNLSSFKTKFVAVRNAINLAYLYTDTAKQEITLSLAQLLTPGPAAVATQVVLNETWALLEANNDWKLILKGRKVPVFKTPQNWALDEGVLKIDNYDGFVDNDSPNGLTYGNYLNLFLSVQNDDVTLLRMMDLIQINMRFNHYNDFLIKEYNVGLDMKITINGDDYKYEKSYDEKKNF